MQRHFWSALFLLSAFLVFGCTVGSTFSENNQNNQNNVNNQNNQNNQNEPADKVRGYWRITAVELVMETEDGPEQMTLTATPVPVTLPEGEEVAISAVGNFLINRLSDTSVDITAVQYLLVNDFLGDTPQAPGSISMTVAPGETENEVTLTMQDGEDTIIWLATRLATDSLQLVFESTTSEDEYTGPTRYLLARVDNSASVFAQQGTMDNLTIVDTDSQEQVLGADTWTLLADGYYYQVSSAWQSSALGFFDWSHMWTYAVDELGETVEGTLTTPRKGYLWDGGSGTYRFYFYGYNGTGNDRAVTFHASLTSVGNIHTFTVNACVDSESTSADLSCSDREIPVAFDIVAP